MPQHVTVNHLSSGDSALDFTQLHQLRRQVRTPTAAGPAQAEAQVARQFEALFIAQLLKQARQTSDASDGSFFDSPQTRTVQSLGDAQLAQQLATPGMGLARVLLEQMRRAAGNVMGADAATGEVDGNHDNRSSAQPPTQHTRTK